LFKCLSLRRRVKNVFLKLFDSNRKRLIMKGKG